MLRARHGVSNHQQLNRLLNGWSRVTIKKTSKFRITGSTGNFIFASSAVAPGPILLQMMSMMTLSNENIFRLRWFPRKRPVTRSFDVFFQIFQIQIQIQKKFIAAQENTNNNLPLQI